MREPSAEARKRGGERGLMHALPIHYSWVILAVGTLGMIMTSPGQTYAVSIFVEHFIQDLGISRGLTSTLYTGGTLAASLLMPVIGRHVDRRGPRLAVVLVATLLGLACAYMGLVRSPLMLLAGFFLVRLLGQQSLWLVSSNVINIWWVRRRGTALGIAGLVTSLLGYGGFPNLIHWLIPLVGWRLTYPLLGTLQWLVMAPLGLLLFRRQPERYGLRPDGGLMSHSPGCEGGPDRREEHWTPSEALRTTTFWIMAAALAATSMLSTGLTFHVVSIFQDSGLSAGLAALVFAPTAATTAVVSLAGGVLADRISPRVLLILALLAQALALVMAPRLSGGEMAYSFGIVLGIAGGLQRIVGSTIWANYFGRRHLGAISGITGMIGAGSSALGPMPMGVGRDLLGSYHTTLTGLAVLPLILAGAVVFARAPRRQAAKGLTTA